MKKLKVITLVIKAMPGGLYEHRAMDSNGKTLHVRIDHASTSKKPYIAALVTKNIGCKYPYGIRHLFSSFESIKTTFWYKRHSLDKRYRPYAIAVLPEHKEAYQEWLKSPTEKNIIGL